MQKLDQCEYSHIELNASLGVRLTLGVNYLTRIWQKYDLRSVVRALLNVEFSSSTCLVGPLIQLPLVVAWLSIFLTSVLTFVTPLMLHYMFRIIIHPLCQAPFEDFSQGVSEVTKSHSEILYLHLILFQSLFFSICMLQGHLGFNLSKRILMFTSKV